MELTNNNGHSRIFITPLPTSEYSFVSIGQDLSHTSVRMTAQEMWDFAALLNEEAGRLREVEDAKLNAEIAELDVKYPKVA